MGFEALLAGKRVTCFGMPFYAGWGLTDDRVKCERRSSTRSLLEVFVYSYLVYPKYLDPMTGKPGTIFDVIEYLSRMRERDAKLSGRLIVLGMRRWKHSQVLPFLKTATNSVYFVADEYQATRLGLRPNDRIVSWGYQEQGAVDSLVSKFSCRRLVVEDGFFRSIGLGSDFVAPLSLVVDDSDGGVYYNAKIPSGIERLLVNRAQISRAELERAADLRKLIVERRLTKYNVDGCKAVELPLAGERRKIFVPGQVETDASIAMATQDVNTNLKLLQTVRALSPDAYIVYKPHPEVVAGNRVGGVSRAELLKYCDLIDVDASCLSLIDACDEVHVMTSQVGFDALLRQKMVVCHGLPFYAGWGLTTDLAPELANGRRGVTCTLNELVAAALILYPTYVDPVSGQVVDAERAIDLLARQNEGALPKPHLGAMTRLRLVLRQFRRLFWFMRASVA
jgi:capsular polysaccharide export protein